MGQPLTKMPYSSTDPFQYVSPPFENYNPAGQISNAPGIGARQANMYYSSGPGPMDYPQDQYPQPSYPSRYQDVGQSGPISNPARFRAAADSVFMDDFLSGPMSCGPMNNQGMMDNAPQRGPPQRRMANQSSGQGGQQGRLTRLDDGFWDDDPVYLPESQSGGFGGDVLQAMRQRITPAQPAQQYRCAPTPAACRPAPRPQVITNSYVAQQHCGVVPPAGAYITQAPTIPLQSNQQQPTIIYYDPKTGGVVGNAGTPQPQSMMTSPQVITLPQMTSQPMMQGLNLSMPTQQPQVVSYNPMQSSYTGGGGGQVVGYQQQPMYYSAY